MDFTRRPVRILLWLAVGLAFVVAVIVVANRRGGVLRPDPRTYEEFTRSFYRGLASLQVGLLDDARRDFTRATELVPGEPSAWANLGLAGIRLGEFDAAVHPVERASALAPGSSDVEFLYGRLEASRGRLDDGIAHLRRAVALDPRALRSRYALAEEIEQAGGPNADAEAQQLFEQLLQLRPDNLAALLERARLASKRADGAAVRDCVTRLQRFESGWPSLAVEQYRSLQRAADAGNFTDAARSVAFLRNVLVRVPSFRESLVEIRTPSELIAEPFERFLKLPVPSALPSPPDEGLAYAREPLGGAATSLVAFSPNGADPAVILVADGNRLRRLDTTSASEFSLAASVASANGLLAVDWSRDFRMDLAVAGPKGLQLMAQRPDGAFADATPAAANGSAFSADMSGVWAADLEMDGDLDLIVGVNAAPPVVLRNNGDGTWRPIQPFTGVVGLRAFAWGDLDLDGDPDAVLLDGAGELHVFANRQGGEFRRMDGPADLHHVLAVTVADIDADGALDLVTLDAGGAITRATWRSGRWDEKPLASSSGKLEPASPGAYRLFAADLDNNGGLDIVASGEGRSILWLAGEGGEFRRLDTAPSAEIFAVVDLNGDGVLDLLGISDGQPVRLMGRGTRGYHWQTVRPRAQETAGDQRINSFGLGGDVEIRSGLLTEKQPISGVPLHFGLGARTGVDVVRIVWPNGVVQADFDSRADEALVAEQRLKGSCPWLFGYDGAAMRFITDFLWRSPLGLRINAQDTAGVTQTEDWIMIRGDQLAPRDGAYDLRVTAELWETHFIDHVSLMVVDHPSDTDVFVDERFSTRPPAFAVHTTTPPRAVGRAWDEAGRDVTDLVARQDGRYLATFDLGPYQGIAQEHFVELQIDEPISRTRPSWLVAAGWVYPTDSSINVAIGQGRTVRPHGLSLEAEDADGRWVVVDPDLGFPAGKNKTMLIDLGAVARAGIERPRRVRLRTNLEVYWDYLGLAGEAAGPPVETHQVQLNRAEVVFRGFSETVHANRRAPEVPIYDRIANVTQRWRDLVGYYTRYGDVIELLRQVDDRYVIMNAGDELRLRFPAEGPPRSGWKRDFVLVGDGWEKDGDYNTSYSSTVEPLPSHDRPNYDDELTAAGLEQDPVYQRHPDDWQKYHTRFVTPADFLRGLRRK